METTSKKIYYIEDDTSIAGQVCIYLENKGYKVAVVNSIAGAKKLITEELPMLVLVDWHLPDGTGTELCRWIRKEYARLPVIIITVRDQINDIINGFQIGADDYITKPFELEILNSRIEALLRRTLVDEELLTCGDITVNTLSLTVYSKDVEVKLSNIEYQLLLLMMENKNRTVTRERILDLIWDVNGSYVNDNTLTVTIKRLREKLNNPLCIKTIRSFGYRMEDV